MPLARASLALALLLSGCSLRAPRLTSEACMNDGQCGTGGRCFAGFCHAPATALSGVVVEVRPPAGSPFGDLRGVALDLRDNPLHDLRLVPPFVVTGVVEQTPSGGGTSAAVPSASVTFRQESPPLPDRAASISVVTDGFGTFSATLPAGSWSIEVEAPAAAGLPPSSSGMPPIAFSSVSGPAQLDLVLPALSSLPTVTGTLAAGGVALAGARVAAVSASGRPLSAPALSAADGSFTLSVPAGTQAYSLQIGAASSPAAATPGAATTTPPLPSYPPIAESGPGALGVVPLDPLPAPATLTGSVVSAGGAPLPGVRVAAISSQGQWVLAASTTTDGAGSFSLSTRAGTVDVAAIPPATPDAPALSPTASLQLPQPAPVRLACPAKVVSLGQVLSADGEPVPAIHVQATLLGNALAPGRTASATATDASGGFQLVADPGSYRVELTQSADLTLPHWVVQPFPAPGTQVASIVLPRATLAAGTVRGEQGGQLLPVASATVDFFALDATGHRSAHLGTGSTDASGRYDVALPDVAASALVP